MTTTNAPSTAPIKHEHEIPNVLQAFLATHAAIATFDLPRSLTHLIHLRASQLNSCAHCIKMHVKEARDDGETSERLDRLIVWRHVTDFTAAERAVLAWTEALTILNDRTDYGPMRASLREHFTDKQIAALTAEIGMINVWNRLNVSKH